MKTKTMIALKNLYYDGDVKENEEFEAREEHVKLLVIRGAAKEKSSDDAPKSKHYSRRDLRAEN